MKKLSVILLLVGLITQAHGTTASAADGASLYSTNCAACHGALASSTVKGKSAADIKNAMKNIAAMGSLSLKPAQISAIAAALKKALPKVTAFQVTSKIDSLTVTIKTFKADNATGFLITETSSAPSASNNGWSATAPTSLTFTSTGNKKLYAWAKDAVGNVSAARTAVATLKSSQGGTLYAASCATCHGPLASSTVAGATASTIKNALNTIGAMSGLKSSLTSAKINAIAKALAVKTQSSPLAAASLPSKQEAFIYGPVTVPAWDEDFAKAMPVGVGPVADSNTVNMRVSAGPFSSPVDVTLILYAPSEGDGQAPVNIYTLQPDNTFAPLTGNVTPWKSGVTGVNEDISAEVPVSELPAGSYVIVFGVTPSGSADTHYHWITGFTVQ